MLPIPAFTTSFSDVPQNAYYNDAVDWAVQNGTELAFVWFAVSSADSRRSKINCSLSLVCGGQLAGGNTPLFHGEL